MWQLHKATNDETLVLWDGETTVHEIPWGALATWGVLLGIEDNTAVLDAILTVTEHHVDVDWPALYAKQREATGTLVAPAQVAAQDMELQKITAHTSPVRQGSSTPIRVTGTQAPMLRGFQAIPAVDPLGDAISGHAQVISEARTQFADSLKPSQ